MDSFNFKTIKDISLKINNRKLAAAEDYNSNIIYDSNYVESFGEIEPIAVVKGKVRYEVNISKMHVYEDNIDIFSLENFDLAIVESNRKITYKGCQWNKVKNFNNKNSIFENISLIAAKRVESA